MFNLIYRLFYQFLLYKTKKNNKDIIFGRNSVTEAIKAERPLDSVMVVRGERSGSIPKILADAKSAGLPIKEVDRRKLDFIILTLNYDRLINFYHIYLPDCQVPPR